MNVQRKFNIPAMPTADVPDARLLATLVANPDHFWVLWERHKHSLVGLCHRWMNGHPHDAENLLSLAMIRAMERLPIHAHKITNLRGWLIRLTKNLAVDMHRERQHLPMAQSFAAFDHEQVEGRFRTEKTGGDDCLDRELTDYIHQEIFKLPERLRTPAVYHFIQELPYSDIASRLAISVENVRKRIQQSRKSLRRGLQAYLDGQTSASLMAVVPNLDDFSEVEVSEIDHAVKSACFPVVDADRMQRRALFISQGGQRHSQKIKSLESYVAKYPTGYRKRVELADLYMAKGLFAEAVEQYECVIACRGDHLNAYLLMALALRHQGKCEEAIKCYTRALQAATQKASRAYIKACITFLHKQFDDALVLFDQAFRHNPNQIVALLGKAEVFIYQGNHPAALEVLKEALAIDANSIPVLTMLLEVLGRFLLGEERIKYAEQLLEIDPHHEHANEILIRRRINQGDLVDEKGNRTRSMIRKLLKTTSSLEGYDLLAHYEHSRGHGDKVLKIVADLVGRHEKSPRAHLLAAKWSYHSHELGTAISHIRTAYQLDAEDKEICEYYLRISVLEADASEIAGMAMEIHANHHDDLRLMFHVVRTLVLVDRETQAKEILVTLGHRHQLSTQSQLEYAHLLSITDRAEDAIFILRRIIESSDADVRILQQLLAYVQLAHIYLEATRKP